MSDSLFRAPSADDLDARPCSERNTAAIRSSVPERSVISSVPEMDAPVLDCTQSFLGLLSTHFLICNDKIRVTVRTAELRHTPVMLASSVLLTAVAVWARNAVLQFPTERKPIWPQELSVRR